jgi:hypothetical protein
MSQQILRTGDKVVELAALAISSAVTTGVLVSGVLVFLISHSWLWTCGGLIAGAAIGLLTGRRVAKKFYRSAEGMTTVVKVGTSSLTATIGAGWAGGILAAFIISLPFLLPIDFGIDGGMLFVISMACAIVVGTLNALMASLL